MLANEMENSMPDNDLDAQAERMLEAAMGGLTPHQLLIQNSQADAANADERAAAIAKNRERAQRLLAALEKSQA
jgi:hypothetical protein